MSQDAPTLLVLGGCGMVGRSFLKYVVGFKLASFIRVADKTPPSMAYLTPEYEAIYNACDFMQVNLANPEHAAKVFQPPQGYPPFALVVNLAAESRFGLPEMLYQQSITDLRLQCALQAQQWQVEKYLEVSTAQVYKCDNGKPVKEDNAKHVKPWTLVGKYHRLAEEATAQIKGLNYCIARLPIVYGAGDSKGLMPRIICAACYEYTGEKMEFLWGEDLRINTLHAQDCAAALWLLLCSGVVGETYNIVDENDTSQGNFNSVLESIFKIRTGFYNVFTSSIAQMKLDEIVDDANEGHMGPWAEMCRICGTQNTPLSPYLEKELLYNNPICLDGTKIRQLGFQCSCPKMTKENILDSIDYWVQLGKFPRPNAEVSSKK